MILRELDPDIQAGRGVRAFENRFGDIRVDAAAHGRRMPRSRDAAHGLPIEHKRDGQRGGIGEIDAELAEPSTYAEREALNRLLDERGVVEGQLQREYGAWEKLVDEQA